MPSKGCKKFTQNERLNFVKAWRKSGMTQTGFARQAGISDKTLSAWVNHAAVKKPTKQSNIEQKMPPLLPVKITQPSSTTNPKNQTSAFNILLPSGIQLSFNATYDMTAAINLIKAYESCS